MGLNLESKFVRELEGESLLKWAIQTIEEMKDIRLVKEEKHYLTKKIFTPEFEHIKKEIIYDHQEDELVISVPVYDERERSHFQQTIFTKHEYDLLPEAGYFVQSDVNLIVRPLGLVEVQYTGSKIARNTRDLRYLQHHLEYKESGYFYYAYDEHTYKQVPTEELEKVKFQLRKNTDFQMDESISEKVKIYIEREETLKWMLNELKPLTEQYQMIFKEFLNAHYSKSGKTTVETVVRYLVDYLHFVKNELPVWLNLKLLYSQITRTEVEALLKEAERLTMVIGRGRELLMKISQVVGSGFKDYDLLNSPMEGTSEFEWKNELLDVILNKELSDFKTPRSSELQLTKLMQGYIGVDIETGEVFPNVAQLEKRRLRREGEQESLYQEQDHMRAIIKHKRKQEKD